ncbi:MAG: sensor histidine kinase [Nocardioidaceae bacterium]
MAEPAVDSRSGLTNYRRYTWWSLVAATGLTLAFLVGTWVLDPDVDVLARSVGGVSLAMTVVACAVLLHVRLDRTPLEPPDRRVVTWLVVGSVGAIGLGAAALAVHNYGLWSLGPATMVAVAATFVSVRARWLLVGGSAAGVAVLGGAVAAAAGDDVAFAAAFPAVMVASIAWVILGLLWSWDVAERLDRARRLSAELAVKDERLRFAADLHDIQGHHLQVIALKSELAARLADSDPSRAASQMREVQQLAADALRDTRAVVQGYRRTSLDDEIANATKVLAAADIDATLALDPAAVARTADLADSERHLLGLAMREATTNVLRHSRARRADVDFRVDDDMVRLRVRNDGATDPNGPTDPTGSDSGTGLPALAERLTSAGGELTWEHDGDRFVVVAALPTGAR